MTVTAGTNSYISVADAQIYAGEQGLTLANADVSLVQATRAIDRLYQEKYIGLKLNTKQALM